MSPVDGIAEARELLSKLKQRLIAGEIDEPVYDRLRERVLSDLTPDERAELGITSTPQPVTPASLSPASGTPRPTPGPTPIGPSGGQRGGLRTARASLSDLDLEQGSVLLGQWKLVRELGRGGFGAVFEAEELSLGERHAVKILDPAMVAKEDLLARFRREVSLMRKLVHPRIVRVYDYREDLSQNLALISMELVAHGSVKQLVAEAKRRKQSIPLTLALNILGEILEALAEAHGQGVIHRDVTPGNVLLAGGSPATLLDHPETDPQVKLVDFGIAGLVERTELSAKSRVLGTAAYVAPEVLDPGVEVTPQADVYGAGAMGYELVTGHLPVGRFDEPMEIREELGKELNRFLLSLLSSRPEARPVAKAGARGLRELREEATKRRTQEADTKAREQAEAGQQQVEQQRKKQEAALRERQQAELRAMGTERKAAAELHRQSEQVRPEGAQRVRETAPTPARAYPSMSAFGREPGARGAPPPLAKLGIVAVGVAVVAWIGWGVTQQKAEDRQRVLAVQQRQAAVAEEKRSAQETPEAERRGQTQLLEQEKQQPAAAAAQAERDRIAREQEAAKERGGVRPLYKQPITEAATTSSRNGNPLSQVQPNQTWLDERTGLLWTATDNGRDIAWDNAKAFCDKQVIAGISDWRLPMQTELEQIYDASLTTPFRIRGSIQVSACCVWSGTLQPFDSSRAGFFYFGAGGGRAWGARASAKNGRVLCVSSSRVGQGPVGDQGGGSASQRIPVPVQKRGRAQPEGTWLDERTGLLWTTRDNGRDINWVDAKSYCQNLTVSGISEWRLPLLSELEALYDESSTKLYKTRGLVEMTACCSWSAQLDFGDSSRGGLFKFISGKRGSNSAKSDTSIRALCVSRAAG